MLWHLVAHAVAGTCPLSSAPACDALWSSLRRRFPRVAAACLMPDHAHLIVEATDPDEVRRAFAQCLAGAARRAGGGPMWRPVPDPEPIRNAKHLQRQIRYVHLNPCRAGLVADPLCWPWSTHRGAVGAEFDPWVSPMDTAARFRRRDAARWLHEYVSGDPSVDIASTPYPVAAAAQPVPVVPLADIAAAARSAAPRSAPGRRALIVLLAYHQGWRDARMIAQVAGITPGQVRRLRKRPATTLLRVGALHLGDARLRHVPDFRVWAAGR